MQCRNCGTEIADKAIVCYRCGAATTDPVRKPVSIRRRSSLVPAFVAMVLLVLGALYMGRAGQTAANPERWQWAAAALVGAAVLILVVRLIRRR